MAASYDEALHLDPVPNDVHEVVDPIRLRRGFVVLRDHTTGDDTAEGVHVCDCRLKLLATHLRTFSTTLWHSFPSLLTFS